MDYINQIEEFYNNILGFVPYDYQVKVALSLLKGENVILSVPTGAGKTWASIAPFLIAYQNSEIHFPDKLIYSLPLRSLVNSIHKDVTKALSEKNQFQRLAAKQTGEYSNDRFFEEDIVFSTIDQTLSSYLNFPLSLSHRQANINAGAITGSYLVFDEFHLLDTERAMSTTIGMLKQLKKLCRFCIMTATLSDYYIQKLKEQLSKRNSTTRVVTLSDFKSDISKIKSLKVPGNHKVKKEISSYPDQQITANKIVQEHQNRTIAICNTVESAQYIYSKLKEVKEKGQLESSLLCIHSRFLPSDRNEKEEEIDKYFGKEGEGNAILIATQVIEAGMDITCDTLFTEISPANSLIQRAGRCARFEDETGKIYVFDVLDRDKIDVLLGKSEEEKSAIRQTNKKYLPYNDELCSQTFKALEEVDYLDKTTIDKLSKEVIQSVEKQMYETQSMGNFNKNKIRDAWQDCQKNNYSSTIRDIESIEVAIVDQQLRDQEINNPYNYESLGVFKWSLLGWLNNLLEEHNEFEGEWYVTIPKENTDSIFDTDWYENSTYFLRPSYNINELKTKNFLFLNKKYFSYSNDLGLNRFGEGKESSKIEKEEHVEKNMTFKKDTLWEHVNGLCYYYKQEFCSSTDFIHTELTNLFGELDWKWLINFMFIVHDYGKMNKKWQCIIKRVQEKAGESPLEEDEVLAHADFNPKEDKISVGKKPSHAGIGALIAYPYLCEKFNEKIARAVCSAIARHHSPTAYRYSKFNIPDDTYSQFQQFIKDKLNVDYSFPRKEKVGGSLQDEIVKIRGKERMLYFYLVRLLRLCDQKATKKLPELK